jgi:hypothetical protein
MVCCICDGCDPCVLVRAVYLQELTKSMEITKKNQRQDVVIMASLVLTEGAIAISYHAQSDLLEFDM